MPCAPYALMTAFQVELSVDIRPLGNSRCLRGTGRPLRGFAGGRGALGAYLHDTGLGRGGLERSREAWGIVTKGRAGRSRPFGGRRLLHLRIAVRIRAATPFLLAGGPLP